MDDENLVPQEAEAAPDDDLLNWTPPELTQRALYTAQKDAGNYQAKKKRLDLANPPEGKHKTLSLALLLGGVALLVLGTVLAAAGANGQQAVMEKGRLWYALWISGQAAKLCVFLLFLLPLEKDMRRPALFTLLGAGLVFEVASAILTTLHQQVEAQRSVLVAGTVFLVLVCLACSPSLWLLLGLARRKTSERMAALAGCAFLFLTVMTAGPPLYLAATGILQGACYIALLFTWPVLERPVLAAPPEETIREGDEPDGQPE
ncbi:MAG: hypothetical protein FWC27_07465 [Firmicutes bacterium]|nr:hypothetical protein [Bacillota bacterium]